MAFCTGGWLGACYGAAHMEALRSVSHGGGPAYSVDGDDVLEPATLTDDHQLELPPALFAMPAGGPTSLPAGAWSDHQLELPPALFAMPAGGPTSLPAGARSVPNVRTDDAAPAPSNLEPERSSNQARGPYQRPQRADEARTYLEMFDAADAINPRPPQLDDDSVLSRQIFVERPVVHRKKGSDKWVTSGGRKGATDIWISPQQGLRKRYGRVVRFGREKSSDTEKLKFAQYTVIRREGADAPIEEVCGAALWVLEPRAPEGDAVPGVLTSTSGLSVHSRTRRSSSQVAPPSLLLRADAGQQFISFGTEPTYGTHGWNSIELGAVVRAGEGGVKFVSTQGDFAEWHRMADGESSLSEGDVVGFHRGRISRNTRHCSMLGIVSRKAVVEGSAPPAHERHRYETVAYQGVVPVKVSNEQSSQLCECPAPRAGQLLVPSGKNDGTALVVPATDGVSRVGIVLHDQNYGQLEDELVRSSTGGGNNNWRLVEAVVVSPTETVATGLLSLSRLGPVLRCCVLGMVFLVGVLGTIGLSPRLGQQPLRKDLPQSHTSARERSCLPVDTPLAAMWSQEGAWKHLPGSLEFTEVSNTVTANELDTPEGAEIIGGCDNGTGRMSTLISLTLDNRGCTGYAGIPYDFALSEVQYDPPPSPNIVTCAKCLAHYMGIA